MDIKPVFNEHKVAMYVSIFPKNWRSMLTSHEISSREAFENNMHHHDTMKTIARASLSNQECFIQGVLYNIFQEMNLRRNFLAAYFVSTNLPQKRDWVLLSNKKKTKTEWVTRLWPKFFPRNQIFIIMWEDQMWYSAMESTVF